MTAAWQRFAAVTYVALLGGGVLLFMGIAIEADTSKEAAGWVTAALLTLREVLAKIETISLGIKTALPPRSDDEGVA